MESNFEFDRDQRSSAYSTPRALVHDETMDILRDEVLQLQRELADRDTRISDLNQLVANLEQEGSTADAPNCDSFALVARLEQLLDELDRRDQREAALEEQLHAAEEACRADQEERRHIETWLSEIEERVGQRETEWQAASESLHQRLREVAHERDRAEQTLAQIATGQHAAPLLDELPADLRRQISELEQRLAEKQQECAALKERIDSIDTAHNAESRTNDVERLHREARQQIELERAELARQRAHLEYEQNHQKRVPDEVDLRVQVLRQHLQEAHARELQQQKERQSQSFSARLAKLWKRLDGSA